MRTRTVKRIDADIADLKARLRELRAERRLAVLRAQRREAQRQRKGAGQ
ncbi:hypothetical protein ACFL09_05345 [Planctomycetota bacterium]